MRRIYSVGVDGEDRVVLTQAPAPGQGASRGHPDQDERKNSAVHTNGLEKPLMGRPTYPTLLHSTLLFQVTTSEQVIRIYL